MRAVLSSDEPSELLAVVAATLDELGVELDVDRPGRPWPEVGRSVGQSVAAGEADIGIVCCWTGTGVAMAANKVPGVRAALCTDAATAEGARRWNDANVLALSLRLVSATVAREIVTAFVRTGPDESERDNISKLR